jgi:hypothetical protein
MKRTSQPTKPSEYEDEEGGPVEATPSSVVYAAARKSGDDSPSELRKANAQLTYRIAKAPSVRNATISKIITEYRATSFLPALSRYLESSAFSSSGARPLLQTINQFDLYKQVQIVKGYLPAVANGTTDRIRAIPPTGESSLQTSGTPAHFDAALVRFKPENVYTQGTALAGLRVAQVCVIFDLPVRFALRSSQSTSTPVRLMYVEWFKPFLQPDPLTGMYTLSRATRSGLPHAEILPLDRLVGSVHLSPRLGTHMDWRLKHTSVLEEWHSFYLNSWITPYTFYQLRHPK